MADTRSNSPVSVRERIETAMNVVSDLCQGRRKWLMSIPARPEEDPDLIIADALRSANKEIDELRQMLWISHTSAPGHLAYGDDGCMDCNACMIDFKGDSLETIRVKMLQYNTRTLEQSEASADTRPEKKFRVTEQGRVEVDTNQLVEDYLDGKRGTEQ